MASQLPPPRLATQADAPAIALVHVEGWRWGYRGVLPSELLDGLSASSREKMWRSVLARQATTEGRVWVAERDDRLVGFVATGSVRAAAPAPEGERVAEVYALYQVEATAGTGLGRQLLAHALDDLRSRGFDAVVLWVIDRNARARRFYERAGFRADGATKDEVLEGTATRDLRYRLALDTMSCPSMSSPAKLIVLVGPKGSGKTTIGRMLERLPEVMFLETEAIAKRVLAAMGNVIDERYARRAFDEIVREVDALDDQHRVIVLETTGASDETPRFLDALRRRHDLRLVRVHAGPETCVRRIAERDPSRQIQVAPELVQQMNARTEALRLPWDLELVNDPPLSAEAAAHAFSPLLDAWGVGQRVP